MFMIIFTILYLSLYSFQKHFIIYNWFVFSLYRIVSLYQIKLLEKSYFYEYFHIG